MMKKLLPLLLVFCLLMTSAGAEGQAVQADEQQRLAGEGVSAVMGYALQAMELMQTCSGENEQSALSLCANMLLPVQAVTVESLAPARTLTESLGELYARDNAFGSLTEGDYYDTCVCWMDNIGAWAYASIFWREGYLKAYLTYCTEEGALIGSEILEAGDRDGITVFLFVDYDPAMMATLRVGVKVAQDGCNVLYTKTLGESKRFRLDVDSWQQGADLGEWSRQLLYPVE